MEKRTCFVCSSEHEVIYEVIATDGDHLYATSQVRAERTVQAWGENDPGSRPRVEATMLCPVRAGRSGTGIVTL